MTDRLMVTKNVGYPPTFPIMLKVKTNVVLWKNTHPKANACDFDWGIRWHSILSAMNTLDKNGFETRVVFWFDN
jgi:hypothetical protein